MILKKVVGLGKNNGTVILMIVALVAIISLISFEPVITAQVSTEQMCVRNFYYCIEDTELPVEVCLDYHTRCAAVGP